MFYDETYLAIVMEYASQGHLSSLLARQGKLSETDARRYTSNACTLKFYQALCYLYTGPVHATRYHFVGYVPVLAWMALVERQP